MAVGLPEQALSKVLSAWYEGVCTQLVSFPTDLRIEQWTVSQAFGQSSAAL
jgi:hypothetical protein